MQEQEQFVGKFKERTPNQNLTFFERYHARQLQGPKHIGYKGILYNKPKNCQTLTTIITMVKL